MKAPADNDIVLSVIIWIVGIGISIYLLTLVFRLFIWLIRGLAKAVGDLWRPIRNGVVPLYKSLFIAVPPDPAAARRNERVLPVTHIVYFLLFVVGVITSAKTLVVYLPGFVTFDELFIIGLLLFMVGNCVHQFLIYKDLTMAEEWDSPFFNRYKGWWVGTIGESVLRLLAMIFLLTLAGEGPLDKLGLLDGLDKRNANVVIAATNIVLYVTFLVWNALAYRRRRSAESSVIPVVEAELKRTSISDALALVLWAAIFVLVYWKQPLLAAPIVLCAPLYALNILYFRGFKGSENRRDYLQTLGYGVVVVSFIVILDFSQLAEHVKKAALSGRSPLNIQALSSAPIDSHDAPR